MSGVWGVQEVVSTFGKGVRHVLLGQLVCHWTSPGTQLSPVAAQLLHAMAATPWVLALVSLLNQVRVTDGSKTLSEFELGSVSPTACEA